MRSCATGTCSPRAAPPCRRCSPRSTGCSRRLVPLAARSTASPSARGPGRYTSLRMGLVTRACSRVRSGCARRGRLDARRPGRRCRRRRCRSSMPAGGRSSRSDPGPACLRPEQLAVEPGRLCVGDGAIRYRDAARGAPGQRFRRTTIRAMFPGRGTTRGSRSRSARPSWPSRSTCGLPTPTGRSSGRRAVIELRPLTLVRPRRDREDRAALVPDSVVPIDVRRRAVEAVVLLRRCLRPRSPQPRRRT